MLFVIRLKLVFNKIIDCQALLYDVKMTKNEMLSAMKYINRNTTIAIENVVVVTLDII